MDTSVGSDGDAYYIRAAMCAASIAGVPSDYDIFALAALRYVASGSTPTTAAPTSSDWSDSDNTESTCTDFPDASLVPLVSEDAPSTALDSVILVRASLPFGDFLHRLIFESDHCHSRHVTEFCCGYHH